MTQCSLPFDSLTPWRQKYFDAWRQSVSPHSEEALIYCSSPAVTSSPEGRASSLLFCDGFFLPSHISGSSSDGISVLPMDLAMHSYGVFLQNQVVRHLQEEKDAWALLNGALHGRGAFLYVPSHACEEVSLELLASQDRWAYSRLMIYLAPHAELTIRVETKGKGKGHFFCEVICDRGARCRYKVLHCSPELSWGHSLRALLKRDSHLLASLYSEGSVWDQTSSKVRLVEEGSEAKLYALSRLDAKRRHGIASLVEHVAPHSVSHQQFHAILYGESRSHIEGKIYVHPHAMQTESYQLSRALLLSNAATLSFSPNLEVLADDVKASHGASIGQLDEESLFYLRSRGLPVEEARRHLLEAFVQEVALCLP